MTYNTTDSIRYYQLVYIHRITHAQSDSVYIITITVPGILQPLRVLYTMSKLLATSVMIYHRGASLSEHAAQWFTLHKAGFVTHK